MKLEQSFEVAAPIDRVWRALIDVERVAPCLPGANVTGRNQDGSYAGNLTIKIGPTTAAYAGRLEMEQIDEAGRMAVMQAQGTDRRGQGGARATITSRLSEASGGTHVDVSTDYHITGRLARFGRGGMIEDISNRLLREFASCLQASLAREPETAAVGPGAQSAPASAATVGTAAPSAETVGAAAPSAETVEVTAPSAETVVAPIPDTHAAAGAPAPQPAPAEPDIPFPGVTPETSNAIEGVPLLASVLWERTKRNPAPVALLLGFLLALLTLRRRRR